MSLHLQDLTLTQTGTCLARLTATIAPGQVLTIMAPSGAGKSSLLAGIAGTLPTGFQMTGRITLNGKDITAMPANLRKLGLLFQDDLLFPHLSVGQNLGFGLPPGGSRAERAARIAEALTAIGLPGFAARDPASLSGGERARVALMRTLLSAPKALLLDEPFARLDQSLRAQIRKLVFESAHALPVILVTHDPADARAAGGPVVDTMGQPVPLA